MHKKKTSIIERKAIKREFSRLLGDATNAMDALADLSEIHPEFSEVNRNYYNYLIQKLMSAHPLID